AARRGHAFHRDVPVGIEGLIFGLDRIDAFGGQQVENLLTRLNIDEALPIESGIVGRLVEQSQTRVEGANFDIRKHLLEYDDVLNAQRARIYSQRDAIFTKEDLSEDVTDMLRTELQTRIPEALKDEEGPWRLLAYLEEIQPTLEYEDVIYPSFAQYLLLDTLQQKIDASPDPQNALRDALIDLGAQALQAEREHMLVSARDMLDKSAESLQLQLDERNEALDNFLDSSNDRDEESAARRPQEILEELSALIRLPVKLNPEQIRQLASDPQTVVDAIRVQVKTQLTGLMISRLIGSFERRLEENLSLRPAQFQDFEWNEVTDVLLQTLEEVFTHREQRLFGSQGQIAHDLDLALERLNTPAPTTGQIIQLLNLMAQGARIAFDRKTHRQGWQRTTRLRYIFLAARLMAAREPRQITDEVLEHLEGAQASMSQVWGKSEWNRLLTSEATLRSLNEVAQRRLAETLGEEHFAELADVPLTEFSAEDKEGVIDVL
ncbi:MAG: hypothetical protein M1281_13195, partial [Chloroflexi bacterium]|nr:hypothetical protein [Chloroflexota bacterium]